MRHFKNDKNQIFAYDEKQCKNKKIKALISQMDEITLEEVARINAPSEEDKKIIRIGELKALLESTDYKTMPDYDGDNTQALIDRKSWRKEIRKLKK